MQTNANVHTTVRESRRKIISTPSEKLLFPMLQPARAKKWGTPYHQLTQYNQQLPQSKEFEGNPAAKRLGFCGNGPAIIGQYRASSGPETIQSVILSALALYAA